MRLIVSQRLSVAKYTQY